eukprot:gb/GFBE01010413.1/.p1 GENE.gb/GFBE01010413.1/~~gb/GFBE01010413.1/.p1  ORF type:complete len:243 (+),score=62.61 gb/GFBE01010413.1/:1-729(+)
MVLARTGGHKKPEEILGVHFLASRATIRQVYHQRARKLHPDKRHGDETAEERAEANARFRELHAAYKELEEDLPWYRMHKTVEEEAYYEAVARKEEAEEKHKKELKRATAIARIYSEDRPRQSKEMTREANKVFREAMEPFEKAARRAQMDWISADVDKWTLESPQDREAKRRKAQRDAEREARRKSQTEAAPSQAEQDVSEDFEERGRFEPERLFAFAAFREFRDDFCEAVGKVGSLIFAS